MICCIVAVYYAAIQYQRFLEDEDASVITFKTFNKYSEDTYPDISFCMKRGHFSKVIEEFTEFPEQFYEMMKGKFERKHTLQ